MLPGNYATPFLVVIMDNEWEKNLLAQFYWPSIADNLTGLHSFNGNVEEYCQLTIHSWRICIVKCYLRLKLHSTD